MDVSKKMAAVSKRKKILLAGGAVAALAVIIVAGISARRSDAVEVQTAKIERRALLESKVTANGEVRPIEYVELMSEVAGRVTDVYVKEGQRVRKNDPLLRVDPTQLSAQTNFAEASLQASQADAQNQIAALAAAENAVLTSRAQLNSSQADYDRAVVEQNNADIELKRRIELVEAGIESRSAYDTAKMRFDSAHASVAAAKARVVASEQQVRDAEIRVTQAKAALNSSNARAAAQRANLDQAADQLKRTTQVSTLDGFIAGPIVKEGTYAIANFQPTPLLLIANMSTVQVEIRVDETDIASVEIGQKAKVKVDALGDRELEGTITEKASWAQNRAGQTTAQAAAAATSQEAKDFKVVVQLINLSDDVRDRLAPGMSATAVITTAGRANVISIPLQALVERDPQQISPAAGTGPKPEAQPAVSPKAAKDAQARKPVKGVFVIQNEKSVFVPVQVGITGENDIEVTSGLQEGQEVVIGPYRQLRTLKNDQKIKREDKNKKPAGAENKS
jgi:HlyD family secretion protein